MKNEQMQTINQKIAIDYLKFFYPPIRNEITQLSTQNNFAGVIQATVNYLRDLLQESRISIIGHHVKLMELIYKKGNSYVKEMIENLFIRSLGSFKKHSKSQHWNMIYQYMPLQFQEVYHEQQKQDEIFFNRN